jgi:hypothetical protein
MTCPNCGGALTGPAFVNLQTPPYTCARCHLGWWVAELTTDARAAWRPRFRDFGYGPVAQAIAEAVAAEIAGGGA